MNHWNPDKIGYWVIGAGYKIKKDLGPVPQIVQKIPQNYCPLLPRGLRLIHLLA